MAGAPATLDLRTRRRSSTDATTEEVKLTPFTIAVSEALSGAASTSLARADASA
ncbi:MAG TPA: hypothetical protein VK387_02785 [Thermoleophilaceae bacterium]|nr:hypothetical protein [Thermoleophilaceae bacterium]